MSSLEFHYSARDIEARILAGIRPAGLNPERCLSAEELGALDDFHTGGLPASRELLEVARIRTEYRVLDIGAWDDTRARRARTTGRATEVADLARPEVVNSESSTRTHTWTPLRWGGFVVQQNRTIQPTRRSR